MSQPSRRDRTRPVELLLLAGGFAVFAGVVVLMSTRDLVLSVIFAGIAFIVGLVALAMLALAVRPTGEEETDLREQDEQQGPTGH